jgi:TonB family protein
MMAESALLETNIDQTFLHSPWRSYRWLAPASMAAAMLAPAALQAQPFILSLAERPQAATSEEMRSCKKPFFPVQATRTEQRGNVTLAFLVDVDGEVIDAVVRTPSKHALLDDAAKAAILRCRFKPRTVNGNPASSWMSVTYHFRLLSGEPTRDMERLRREAVTGNLEAFYQLALAFRNELDDSEQAMTMLREAAVHGHPEAIHDLANALWNGDDVRENQPKALSYYMSAAQLGHARSQFVIGAAYSSGLGVVRDAAKAMQWFDWAARLGNPDAQIALADSLASGIGGAPDHQGAAGWYRLAAQAGDDLAQRKLAQCYLEGKGVDRDPAQAAFWLRKAADQHQPKAEAMLASLYLEGAGVPVNHGEALTLLHRSATGGDVGAMVSLGDLLAKGGRGADPAKAARWYRRAAALGDASAIRRLAMPTHCAPQFPTQSVDNFVSNSGQLCQSP